MGNPTPRLLTDARASPGGGTGVARYGRALADAQGVLDARALVLTGGPEEDARWRRRLRALPRHARAGTIRGDGTVLVRDVFRVAQIHFDLYRRPLEIALPGPPGIAHWAYPLPIHARGWANLYTVHDAIPLVRPDLTPIDPRRHRRLLAALIPVAAGLVTVSAAAAREVVDALGVEAGFVADCGSAVATPPADPAQLPPGLVPGGYLLALGAVEVRKNLGRLIDAHATAGRPLPLVVAGPDGWGAGSLAAGLAGPGIVRLPWLADGAVTALIAHARALVMPSLAEGFGLPVAEAMALGTPVVTSRGGALEETAGGAALLVDPTDVGAIAAALVRVTSDADLRAALAAAGRANVARFTAERFTARLAALYARVAPSGGR